MVQIIEVQSRRRSYRHRNAVHRYRIKVANRIKGVERSSAGDHEVFRNNLDEIDRDRSGEKITIMFFAKAKAKTAKGWNRVVHVLPEKGARPG